MVYSDDMVYTVDMIYNVKGLFINDVVITWGGGVVSQKMTCDDIMGWENDDEIPSFYWNFMSAPNFEYI